ncbi:ImmA/IrrE family metallo-endopeptidase [Ruminococcaceae bacterium OttesenSCG-928-I18]|nr:ImmA/IrrE family metallo-endopeptidase [Ruminococcaceae bacterium OttesenSCG-928-I18]
MKKAELYAHVERFSRDNKLKPDQYPRNALAVSTQYGLTVHYAEFTSDRIRGVALISDNLTILNYRLLPRQRNYFAAHELVHHDNHGDIKTEFYCSVGNPDNRKYYEWEANEGAAEFLVPYKSLLPTIKCNIRDIHSPDDMEVFRTNLAKQFNVPKQTIYYRMERLKYAIYQYLGGTPLSQLVIISHKEQESRGISVNSLNDVYDEML